MRFPIIFKKFWTLAIVSLLLSCDRSIEITKLAVDSSAVTTQLAQKGFRRFEEYFVIKNPPRAAKELQSLIDSINSNTAFLPKDSADFEYAKYYYRETKFTPRNYKEGEDLGFWGTDYIDSHNKDLLLVVTWFQTGCRRGMFYMFYEHGKRSKKDSFISIDSSSCVN